MYPKLNLKEAPVYLTVKMPAKQLAEDLKKAARIDDDVVADAKKILIFIQGESLQELNKTSFNIKEKILNLGFILLCHLIR